MSSIDLNERYAKLSEQGDPLERLNHLIDWRIFKPLIDKAFNKQRKSPAGRKPYNRLMMFKVLVLQGLYNLSDKQTEYQLRDRLSFIRFLGLSLSDVTPDEKTIWAYREVLVQGDVIDKLFDKFNVYLEKQGLGAETGMLVDASIVEVPKQRNNRDDNKKIKEGRTPHDWHDNPNKLRQKDVQARWTMKAGVTYYGYKNHINADTKHKLIRRFHVTSASSPDNKHLGKLLDPRNTWQWLWADGMYRTPENVALLAALGIKDKMHFRRTKGKWITSEKARENKRRATVRKRVEHIFGFMQNSMGGKLIRTIGLARAKAKIGMMNLVYNLCRFEQINRLSLA